VAAGVRILGAEGRTEGVDLGQRQAVGLDIELTRDRQERLAAKEILRAIFPSGYVAGWRGPGSTPGTMPRAPSASEAVMIGVLTQKNPFSSKKRWIACAKLCDTRVAALITLVRPQMCDLAAAA
jgi:hypothetical protein